VQRTRKDRVAQLDLFDDDRAHVVLVLELHAPGLGVGGAGGSVMQILELALRQVNCQVSEPLLKLRAPLVRSLQVVEPAPRLVPLNLLLELRVQLVLLDRTPLCSEACWPFTGAENLVLDINLGDKTDPGGIFSSRWGEVRFFLLKIWSSRNRGSLLSGSVVCFVRVFGCVVVRVLCV